MALPADVLAAVTKANADLARSRALAAQLDKVQATFEHARKVTDAAGTMPAKAQLDKAAELARAATEIVELMGPENVRRLTEQMRRAAAAARAAQNVGPLRHGPPKCGTRARAPRGRAVRRHGSRRGAAATRAGPDDGSGDPEPGSSSVHLDRYALAGRSA